MITGEFLVVFMLAVFVLLGLGSFIAEPIIARRFYRDHAFVDQGKSLLDSPGESVLLSALATSGLYRGEYKEHRVQQCKAYPIDRRKFTLNKLTRKYNQSRWSLSELHSSSALPPFCLLPLSDPETMFIMQDDKGVDLSDDELMADRYFLRTDFPEKVKQLITVNSREYLLSPELISVECVDNTVLIKRKWPSKKIAFNLLQDLDCAIDIAQTLSHQR